MRGTTFVLLVTFAVCSSASKRRRDGDQATPSRQNRFGDDLFPAIFDQIADAITGEQCKSQLIRHREHANNFTLWAMQMVDASAKLPSGLLAGSRGHLGHFDECLAANNGERGVARIAGKYCIASVELTARGPQAADPASAWHVLQAPTNRMKLQRNLLELAICVPSACLGEDLEQGLHFLETRFPSVSIKTTIDETKCQVESLASEGWLPFFWCAVVLYAAFLFMTDRQLLNQNKQDVTSATVWQRAFSVRAHWRQLTSCQRSLESNRDSIDCIHGMRMLSMVVIVMGHRGEALTAGPLVNGEAIEQMYEDFLSIMAMNGHLIVDVFFTMSGFLISWNLLRTLDMGKRVNVLSLYVYRYLRLTPALMLVIAFEAFVLFDLSSGPLWKVKVGTERDNCRNNWWTNLLYVNNYVQPKHPCVDPSWYLACDMQMFLVAPFVVMALKRWQKHGYAILMAIISIAMMIPFVVTYMGDLDPTIIPDPSTLGHSAENHTYVSVYVTAYCRAGPYFVGMAFAYWLHEMKANNATMSEFVVRSGWVLGPLAQFATLAAAVVFYGPEHGGLGKASVALYAALHRTVFAVGVAFAITACALGRGGVVNRVLSWRRFRPFSRLTYSVFLCHTVVQMYHVGSVRTQMFMSYTDIVWLSISDLVLSVAFAAALYLTVERPVLALATALLDSASSTRQQRNPDRGLVRPEGNGIAKSVPIGRDALTDMIGLAQLIHLERDNKKRG